MRTLLTYLLIAVFSVGTLQASMKHCVMMDMQDTQKEVPVNMTDDDSVSCHTMDEEAPVEQANENSCCDEGCDSCASVSVTFNSSVNKFAQMHVNNFTSTIVFALPSNHLKIPTPPPNS